MPLAHERGSSGACRDTRTRPLETALRPPWRPADHSRPRRTLPAARGGHRTRDRVAQSRAGATARSRRCRVGCGAAQDTLCPVSARQPVCRLIAAHRPHGKREAGTGRGERDRGQVPAVGRRRLLGRCPAGNRLGTEAVSQVGRPFGTARADSAAGGTADRSQRHPAEDRTRRMGFRGEFGGIRSSQVSWRPAAHGVAANGPRGARMEGTAPPDRESDIGGRSAGSRSDNCRVGPARARQRRRRPPATDARG